MLFTKEPSTNTYSVAVGINPLFPLANILRSGVKETWLIIRMLALYYVARGLFLILFRVV